MDAGHLLQVESSRSLWPQACLRTEGPGSVSEPGRAKFSLKINTQVFIATVCSLRLLTLPAFHQQEGVGSQVKNGKEKG